MPGITLTEGALEVSKVDTGDELISRLQTLGEDFGATIEGWQTDRVREVLKTDRYFHAIHFQKPSRSMHERMSADLLRWRKAQA
jgi:hypothetical protein